jgi:hypothetical protein
MTTIESTSQVIGQAEVPFTLDEDQLVAVAFLARFSGRTLGGLPPRPGRAGGHHTHLELYRTSIS